MPALVIPRILGGLGNQLFVYAAARRLARLLRHVYGGDKRIRALDLGTFPEYTSRFPNLTSFCHVSRIYITVPEYNLRT